MMSKAQDAAPPTVSHEFKATRLVVSVPILLFVSLVLFSTRIYTRAVPNFRLWWDDYIMAVAVLLGLVEAILLESSVGYGLGRHGSTVEPEHQVQAEKLVYLSLLTSVWALAFAKTSIAFLLLRILRVSRPWRVFSYSITTFILVAAIITAAFQLTICKPISAMWNHTVDHVCVSKATLQEEIIATAALTILTDVVLSLVPLLFIVSIPTSIRQKVVVAILMSMGLVASFASVFKIVLVSTTSPSGDPLIDAVGVHFWTILEVQLGIMAACIPCVKQPFQRLLHRLGMFQGLESTRCRNGYLSAPDSSEAANQSLQLWNFGGGKLQNAATAILEGRVAGMETKTCRHLALHGA